MNITNLKGIYVAFLGIDTKENLEKVKVIEKLIRASHIQDISIKECLGTGDFFIHIDCYNMQVEVNNLVNILERASVNVPVSFKIEIRGEIPAKKMIKKKPEKLLPVFPL